MSGWRGLTTLICNEMEGRGNGKEEERHTVGVWSQHRMVTHAQRRSRERMKSGLFTTPQRWVNRKDDYKSANEINRLFWCRTGKKQG